MKQYILVAGVAFDNPKSLPRYHPFDVRCETYKNILKKQNRKEDLIFHIFSFTTGKATTQKIIYRQGRPVELPVSNLQLDSKELNLKEITRHSYALKPRLDLGEEKLRFLPNQADKMSIIHVYKKIREIGEKDPNSLWEVSIFSHAWWGGPILVNSVAEDKYALARKRDPEDHDARVFDFDFHNMHPDELRYAFNPSAIIRIWGCNAEKNWGGILKKVVEHPLYRKYNGQVWDEELFTISLTESEAEWLQLYVSNYIGRFPDRKNIKIKFKWLKYFFCVGNVGYYPYIICYYARVKTYGGLLATSSHFEGGLMKVGGFVKEIEFYKKSLNFEIEQGTTISHRKSKQ